MFKCASRIFFANAPQLRKALLKFGKRWSVVRRARHRRQLSVVIALSQEMGIFTWHLIKPLPRLIQNASRIILWRFHMDDFSSSCGKKLIFLLQVSLFCPEYWFKFRIWFHGYRRWQGCCREWSWRRWCVDLTWRLNLVPFGGRDKGRLRRSQARKGRPLHIAEIYKEQKPFKETITNWYTICKN